MLSHELESKITQARIKEVRKDIKTRVGSTEENPLNVGLNSVVVYESASIDSSEDQLGKKSVMTPDDLVRKAKESGIINFLPERQRLVLELLNPQEGEPLTLQQIGDQMGVTRKAISVLKKKGYRKLKKALGVEISPVIVKTPAMREIEIEYGLPIEQVLRNFAREGLSRREIGKKLQKDHKTINDWCGKLNIEAKANKPRKTSRMIEIEEKFGKPIEKILGKKFIDQKRTPDRIAIELGLNRDTVIRWIKIFGFRPRTHREAAEIVFSDPIKRKKILKRSPERRRKLSESLKRYHQRRREEI